MSMTYIVTYHPDGSPFNIHGIPDHMPEVLEAAKGDRMWATAEHIGQRFTLAPIDPETHVNGGPAPMNPAA